MRTKYNKITLSAFRLKKQLPVETFSVLKFPQAAIPVIKNLMAEREGKNADKVNIPIKSLHSALRLLAPGLIHIEYPFNNENNFWLYSREPISNEILSVILSYWIDTEFPDKNTDKKKKGKRDKAKKCLYPDRLIWETQTLDTSLWSQHENGTANIIDNSNGFILLPDLVATQLSKPGLEFNFSSEKLQFYRCAPLGGSGSELISWPPLSYEKKEQKYYYSVVLTLKVQTIPFQSYPQLQCDVSIRRWCSVSDTRLLSEGQASSVYIRSQLNWGED